MDDQIQYSPKQILIFEGVMNLLQEGRPIHELKVAEIAEASGMGKSTAYEYFSSKEEIIREALTYHMSENFKIWSGLSLRQKASKEYWRRRSSFWKKAWIKGSREFFFSCCQSISLHQPRGPIWIPS